MSEANVSIASSSVRVGHLVKRAMTFFDTNREAAWRCLRGCIDAARLGDRGRSRADSRTNRT
jgi:hypothetical protein